MNRVESKRYTVDNQNNSGHDWQKGTQDMRQGMAGRRSRNRGQGSGGQGAHNHNQGQYRRHGGGNNRVQVIDSNGPEVRIRGNANQICEKYMALAKDAESQGNRVLAESYLQHAEHYQRMINLWAAENPQREQPSQSSNEVTPMVVEQQGGSASAPAGEDLGLPESLVGQRATTLVEA